jgi:hypothetical protein
MLLGGCVRKSKIRPPARDSGAVGLLHVPAFENDLVYPRVALRKQCIGLTRNLFELISAE